MGAALCRLRRSGRTVMSEGLRRVAVVGGGIAGLSTAWHLQEYGVDVTVIERSHVAAGSSWGNAGWLTPGLTAPLPDPAVLRYGLRTVLQPSSPVYIPAQASPRLIRFLAGFTRHCTQKRWTKGAHAYRPLNEEALAAFAELSAGSHIPSPKAAAPFLACFRSPEDREHLEAELRLMRELDQAVEFDRLTGSEVRAITPAVSKEITAGLSLHGQQYIHPPRFMAALADAVVSRGGKLCEGINVVDIHDDTHGVILSYREGGQGSFDCVVLANGAWLSHLARPFGVRRLVQAGRGYSFSVGGAGVPSNPVYFPSQRVACTPLETPGGPRLRVAGMMEFQRPDAPLDQRRIGAIVDAVRPLFDDLDLDDREDEWVGSRPCTSDGLPLIGATKSPHVFVAGGHGMWGVALGPLTGKLLARQMVSGEVPEVLRPFDPLR